MKRICFIGNSHIAALRLTLDGAWENTAGCEVTLFGSHGQTILACDIGDGRMTPTNHEVAQNFTWTSGGLADVDFDAYDLIAVVAGPSVFKCSAFWAPTTPADAFDIPLLSDAVIEHILDATANTWGVRLAQKIAEATAREVVHLGVPIASEAAPFSRTVLAHLDATGEESMDHVHVYQTELAGLAARLERGNLRFGAPPADTLETYGIYTKHRFCRGSRKLTEHMDVEHAEDDFVHMNADYGAAVLAQVVTYL